MKIRGPYKRNIDGRWYMKIEYENGKSTTLSYPKYLMEQKLGRLLDKDETVDHIDRNIDNNLFSNLKIIDRSTHAKEDSFRLKPMAFICLLCGIQFVKKGSKLRDVINNRRKGKAGPFCGRPCAGRYGAEVGHYKIEKIIVDIKKFEKENKRKYYQLKKPR